MANTMMIIGLLGLSAGILSPIFRVMNNKSSRSKGWVITLGLSFLIFLCGVVLGLA